MISLFKLPFRVGRSVQSREDYASDLAAGLLKNYLRHRKDLSEKDLDNACDIAAREMALLRQQFQENGKENNYELISAALRNIEKNLG